MDEVSCCRCGGIDGKGDDGGLWSASLAIILRFLGKEAVAMVGELPR